MKLGNRQFDKPNVAYAVIPRPDKDVVFKAQAVLDFDNFDKLCPMPKAPLASRPGGETFENVEHPKYKNDIIAWSTKRHHWLVLESLKATTDLQWDTVKAEDSSTWGNYMEEFKKAYFTVREVNEIIGAILQANSLDDDKLEEAKKRFLQQGPSKPVN